MLVTLLVAGLLLVGLYRWIGNGCVTRLVFGCMALLLVLYAVSSLPPGGGGSGGDSRASVLLAIGDSFSSGEGAGEPWERTDRGDVHPCRRSALAYGPLLSPGSEWAEATGMDLDREVRHVACQGATAGEVSDQYALLSSQDRRRTDLIVVTMGGNDVGFSSILETCLTRRRGESCLRTYRPGGADLLSYVIAAATNKVRDELREIAGDFPDATVLLLSYPPIFAGERTDIACDFAAPGNLDYLGAEEIEYLAGKGAELNRSLETAVTELEADGLRIGFVPIDGPFRGHELCRTSGSGSSAEQVSNRDSWLNDIRLRAQRNPLDPRSFHPTAAGYEAMATCLWSYVENGSNDC